MCYMVLIQLWRMPPVTKTITLRQANQAFARCVREVEAGEEYLITRNGKPVARLVSAASDQSRRLSAAQEAALARTRARMAKGWPIGAGVLDRDALHERVAQRLEAMLAAG